MDIIQNKLKIENAASSILSAAKKTRKDSHKSSALIAIRYATWGDLWCLVLNKEIKKKFLWPSVLTATIFEQSFLNVENFFEEINELYFVELFFYFAHVTKWKWNNNLCI